MNMEKTNFKLSWGKKKNQLVSCLKYVILPKKKKKKKTMKKKAIRENKKAKQFTLVHQYFTRPK